MTARGSGRRGRAGRGSSRGPARIGWVLLGLFVVLMGAYLWDTEGPGPVILAVVLSVVLGGFTQSRSRLRRRHR